MKYIIVLILASCGSSTGYWQTPVNNSELTDHLNVTSGEPEHSPAQIFKLNVGQVQVGEIYEVFGEDEVTNDNAYVISVVNGIIASTHSDSTGQYEGDIEVTEFNGTNVDLTEHHLVAVKNGAVQISADIKRAFGDKDVYFIWVAMAVSSAWKHVGPIKVDVDYGRMILMRR